MEKEEKVQEGTSIKEAEVKVEEKKPKKLKFWQDPMVQVEY